MTPWRLATALAVAVITTGVAATPAGATEAGRIVELVAADGTLRVVFQADGLPDGVAVDPKSVVVQVNGEIVDSDAEPLLDGTTKVSRTAVLAIDNSRSMAGEPLAAAKAAATTFLSGLPEDVTVGLVTFGDTAEVTVPATPDRARVQAAIDDLTLDDTVGTALFDAVARAADATGDHGARNVLLLTDGNEDGSSDLTLDGAVGRATDDGVAVGAVYIGEDGQQPPELTQLIGDAGGQVVTAGTDDLASAFADFAQAISTQLVVKAPVRLGTSGNVLVSGRAGDVTISDGAFLAASGRVAPQADYGPRAVERGDGGGLLTETSLPYVIGTLFVGLVALLYL
ncbi:MAG: vWA domain-containing protein, partial [Actinomycetes bacterium]